MKVVGPAPIAIFGHKFRLDLIDTIKQEQEHIKARLKGFNLSIDFDKLTYSDKLYGTITVSGDSELRLHYGPGLMGRLEHWHYDTFRVHWDAEWRGSADVMFRLGADGSVSALEVGGSTFARADAEAP